MRWGTFGAALLLVLVAQKTLLWNWGLASGQPLSINLFLALALLLALNAPAADARVACWVCGFVQDLGSLPEPVGIHSFTLGLTGLLLVGLRESGAGRTLPIRWTAALGSAWAGQFVYLLHLQLWLAQGSGTAWTLLSGSFSIAFWSTLIALAGAAAPAIIWRRRGARPARRW